MNTGITTKHVHAHAMPFNIPYNQRKYNYNSSGYVQGHLTQRMIGFAILVGVSKFSAHIPKRGQSYDIVVRSNTTMTSRPATKLFNRAHY